MDTISIVGRIKEGFKIWRKGWLSFILAEILLSFAFTIFLIPAIVGAASIADYFGGGSIFSATISSFAVMVLGIAFNFLIVGTMCGLGKELIEIEDTRAENTLHYIKNYGLKFAAIGLIISAVVFGPFIAVGLLLTFLNILTVTSLNIVEGIALGIFAFLVGFFLFVPFSLAIPACLIDDIGIKESVENSFQVFKKNPTTLIGLLGSFVLIFLALFSPLIGLIVMPKNNIIPVLAVALPIFGVIAFFGSLFVLFPVMCITFTKFYYDYSPQKKDVSEEESPIRLF